MVGTQGRPMDTEESITLPKEDIDMVRLMRRPPTIRTATWGTFFSMAKAECANYSDTGPWGIRHYCCFEPKETANKCVLTAEMPCKWFEERVIPLKKYEGKGIKTLWDHLASDYRRNKGSSVTQKEPDRTRVCKCGAAFEPGSNRQQCCPSCSSKQKLEATRNRVRKHRSKESVCNALEPCEPATSAG